MSPQILEELKRVLEHFDAVQEFVLAAQLQAVIDRLESGIAANSQVTKVLCSAT